MPKPWFCARSGQLLSLWCRGGGVTLVLDPTHTHTPTLGSGHSPGPGPVSARLQEDFGNFFLWGGGRENALRCAGKCGWEDFCSTPGQCRCPKTFSQPARHSSCISVDVGPLLLPSCAQSLPLSTQDDPSPTLNWSQSHLGFILVSS